MKCLVEIADEPLSGGYPWTVDWAFGRSEVGVAATYMGAIQDVGDALRRERIATGVYAYYDRHRAAHTDAGD